MKGDPTYWILARSSGFTAYALVTASVLTGLTVKGRPFGKLLRAAGITDLHGFLALLALGAIAAHGLALVADDVVTITYVDLLVPGRVDYRPLWTGAGIVAAELMLLVYASFYLRRWIGVAMWRRLHWSTYVIFGLVTAHGLMSGTDSSRPWAIDAYVVALGLVATATAWRCLAAGGRLPSSRRRVAVERRSSEVA